MSSEIVLDIEWFRCPDGYRIVDEEEWARLTKREGIPLSDDEVIVPNSAEQIPCYPSDNSESLVMEFAHIRTSEGLLKFITRCGPLEMSYDGEWIGPLLNTAQEFRNLLSCKSKGPRKVAAVFEAQRRARWNKLQKDNGRLPSEPEWEYLCEHIGAVYLVPDPARGVRLQIAANSLFEVILGQLGRKLSGATTYRECRQCGDLFEAGPGTGVRADATFCRPEHSVIFHSLKRSNGV